MSTVPAIPDPIAYWNSEAGQRWVEQQARMDAMLAPISDVLLQTARIQPGERVLDVGCGCGDTSLQAARLVGEGGAVLGADVSAPMLARARERQGSGLPRLRFVEADAAAYAFEPASFDLLLSRFGVMFFPDPAAAFANLRRGVRPGGRAAFACWRDAAENEWVSVPVAAARAHVPPTPILEPGSVGPFAFADAARVRGILEGAGFRDVDCAPFDARLSIGATLEEAVADLQQLGPAARMLAEATPEQRERVVAAIRDALAPLGEPVRLGGAVWIVTARA